MTKVRLIVRSYMMYMMYCTYVKEMLLSPPLMSLTFMKVFKLNVQKTATEGYFIFRRYTDFTRLNMKLKILYPCFRLALPPKRWFGNNFDPIFLEDRLLGLQAFLNNITGHKEIRKSAPVKEFLCLNDPPGPHDSLEESRVSCFLYPPPFLKG
nr:sorting nexin-16-like [Lytechinus pictus]